MKKILLLVGMAGLLCCSAFAENPFQKYNDALLILNRKLAQASEKQKAAINARIEKVKQDKTELVNKYKQKYQKELEDLNAKAAKIKGKRKAKIDARIQYLQKVLQKIDEMAKDPTLPQQAVKTTAAK